MQKNKLYILIVLLGVGLLGLAFLQVNWIKSSMVLRKQQFDGKVYSALQKTTETIESRDAYHQTSDIFCEFSFYEQDSKLLYKYDSLIASKNENLNKTNTDSMSIDFRLFDIQNVPRLITQKTQLRKVGDKIITQRVQFDTVTASDKVSQTKIDGNIRVFEKLVKSYMTAGKSISQRVDSVYLFDQLKNNLQNQGIDSNFKYRVEDINGVFMMGNNKKLKEHDFQYKTTLFQNDMFGKGGYLFVKLDNNNYSLFAEFWKPLLLSILFTLLILICLFLLIQIIYDQRKLSQLKTDFINNMTHELKTPVATISMASEMMKNSEIHKDETRFKKYANIIFDENKRLGHHIEAVLNISQLERKELNLDFKTHDFHQIIEDVIERNSLKLNAVMAELKLSLNANNHEILCDKMHMNNVVNNLIDNAIKYSPNGVKIEIKTYNKDNSVFLEIIDQGLGISKENINKIFQKFYRVEGGNIQNIKGFGLGLSYVKFMVEAHQGNINVHSKLNEGTTFVLQFKCVKKN
jgi:two-component system phosphate regulon sensor histidine kinase PhoR